MRNVGHDRSNVLHAIFARRGGRYDTPHVALTRHHGRELCNCWSCLCLFVLFVLREAKKRYSMNLYFLRSHDNFMIQLHNAFWNLLFCFQKKSIDISIVSQLVQRLSCHIRLYFLKKGFQFIWIIERKQQQLLPEMTIGPIVSSSFAATKCTWSLSYCRPMRCQVNVTD